MIVRSSIYRCRRPHQRHVYDRKIIDILNNWYLKHKTYPYASKEEKMELVNQTSLSEKQITTWLINARFKNFILYFIKDNRKLNVLK